ncbi:MAG: phytanoyl-CoA dioxygenase family protein [Reichenbachiella sp.]
MKPNHPIQLTSDQLDFWNNNSYLHISGLFRDQVDEMSSWINDIANWGKSDSEWINYFEMDAPTQLSRVENFVPNHKGFSNIFQGEIVLGLMAQLMSEEAVLYKERINFKSPGGGPHAAHQDGVAYEQGENIQFDPNTKPYLSILVSVDDATSENGCLEVVPNWPIDDLQILPMEAPIKYNPKYMKIQQSVEDELEWIKLPTRPGDVLIFTERLPHRSMANLSHSTRRIIYGVYNPLSMGDKRRQYYIDKRNNPHDSRYMVGNPHAPLV